MAVFFYWMNLKITSKEGKLSQRFPWKVGRQLCGFGAGGESEEQKWPRVELQPGRDTREEDKMKADLKKSLLRVAMRKQIGGCWECGGRKGTGEQKKKKKCRQWEQ